MGAASGLILSVLLMDLPNQISSILNPLPPQINNFLSGKMQTAAPPSYIKTNANCLELFHSIPIMIAGVLAIYGFDVFCYCSRTLQAVTSNDYNEGQPLP